MRGASIAYLSVASLLLSGCVSGRMMARKERLPDATLQSSRTASGEPGVDTVLRAGATGNPSSIPTAVPATTTGAPAGKVEYASLVTEDHAVPDLPPAQQPVTASRPMAQPAPVTAMPTNSSDRTRAIAARIQQQCPERLSEFMQEIRQGAIQGNWDAVLSSWEVSLEFQGAPAPTRSNSLMAALDNAQTREPPRREMSSEPQPDMRYEPVPAARVMSVSSSNEVNNQAPVLEQPLAASSSMRKLPYRIEESVPRDPSNRMPSRSQGTDFASWAEFTEEKASSQYGDSARWQVYGRLLYAMAGDSRKALEPIDGLDSTDRRFWRGYVYALDRYFDDDLAKPEDRATEAAVALRDSIDALSEKADLEISEPIFCRAVHSFGNFEEFDQTSFRPGDGVVVYWECRHFVSVESAEGYRTKMKAEFEIIDSLGNRRHQFEQKFKDDVCRTRRHDYFNVVVFEWPRDLTAGEYTLKVTVTDLTSNKMAEKQRRFQIAR